MGRPGDQGKEVTQIGLIGPLRMIVDADGQVCGYIWLAARRWSNALRVLALQLYPHVNWQQVMPVLPRAVRVPTANKRRRSARMLKPFSEISFALGRSHPAYTGSGEKLAPRANHRMHGTCGWPICPASFFILRRCWSSG